MDRAIGSDRSVKEHYGMAQNLIDAVYGCLIGGAIGDALGAPIEGGYYTDIRKDPGELTELVPTYRGNTGDRYLASRGEPGVAGAITDDTTLRHYLCLTIVRKGGRVTPDDFAAIWLEKLNPNRFWLNERIVLQKLQIGMNPWETGRGQPPAGCATMAIAPVGIVNAGNPAQAYQDAVHIASLNQDGVNRDAAATVAAGVAAAFLPEATVDSVIATMMEHSVDVVRRGLVLTMDLAVTSSSVDEFAEKFYATMLDWTWPSRNWTKERFFSGSSLEFMPVVPALLHLCGGDVNQSIIEGANFGRDCDTIGSLAGNIAGVLHGASAIRPEWIEQVEQANVEFFEEVEGDRAANFHSMAERLVTVLGQERQAAEQRARLLGTIID